jgi:hypothetical protein
VWWVRGTRAGSSWQITVALSNILKMEAPSRVDSEEATFFQVGFSVMAGKGCHLVPRETARAANDDDSETNDLIYRSALEWAVGHTCGASWETESKGQERIIATWLPSHVVRSMDAGGHPFFAAESKAATGSETGAFEATSLGAAKTPAALAALLGVIPAAYGKWLDQQESQVNTLAKGSLPAAQVHLAKSNIKQARGMAARMSRGIDVLRTNAKAFEAFQLSQRAMVLQRQWAMEKPKAGLTWRPFQLGFQLLTLAGLVEPGTREAPSIDRKTMDLLWFPTGGGKTEAYLALTAFVLLLRRLREDSPDQGAGVAVLMRYTLRLLTVQQFERASRLVLACEFLRRQRVATGNTALGSVPFSIGLWVGGDATPNTIEAARLPEGRRKARQLARCPACRQETLKWDARSTTPRFAVLCENKSCPLTGADLPVYTIDEELYEQRPSLVIGTVDKFAQIVRNAKTHRLFGDGLPPPELIIQDELHLISGPLGTVTGIYEAAIDQLCSVSGVPPKVIGSTATIRRAQDQVLALFHRKVAQFPPPVLDADDSCFAVVDEDVPGRLYVGISTAGRSPKFVLQAACASLMQGAAELAVPDQERDPYWTLVAYFNSLRELGGALVMMHDDVTDSIKIYSELHGKPPRDMPDEPLELTSRVSSEQIPAHLDRLAQPYPDQTIAAVLATNMLSVGVDIPRLGLMVINGQPKSMAEYIQASSRVGRGNVAGLVVTLYNAGRPRDRSHFEAFRTWHQALYREVEATSVTPFAPRARDRALHAAIVALGRHLVPGMLSAPHLTPKKRTQLQLLVDELVSRAQDVDPDEATEVQADASSFLDVWEGRGPLKTYWDDRHPADSLLIGAEKVATERAARGAYKGDARATPNSMREVEPGVDFRLVPALRSADTTTVGASAAPTPVAVPAKKTNSRKKEG